MIELTIDASQLHPLAAQMEARFGNAAGAMFLRNMVVPYFRRESFRTFAQGTGRKTSWPPLDKDTITDKALLGVAQPEKPLIRTGEMMSKVWQFMGSVFPIPGGIELIYPDPREAQEIRRYVGHQLGGVHGGRASPNLPARPMVEIADQDEAAIIAMAQAHFLTGMV